MCWSWLQATILLIARNLYNFFTIIIFRRIKSAFYAKSYGFFLVFTWRELYFRLLNLSCLLRHLINIRSTFWCFWHRSWHNLIFTIFLEDIGILFCYLLNFLIKFVHFHDVPFLVFVCFFLEVMPLVSIHVLPLNSNLFHYFKRAHLRASLHD